MKILSTNHKAQAQLKISPGFTLFEVLVAMLLLGMIAAMIYSVLNVGVTVTAKGEKEILVMSQRSSFLSLLQNQVLAAWFDEKENKPHISTQEGILKLITCAPLLDKNARVVLAVYYYDTVNNVVYYVEKKDFYNSEYKEDDYIPRQDEMVALFTPQEPLAMEFDPEENILHLSLGAEEYQLVPKCPNSTW